MALTKAPAELLNLDSGITISTADNLTQLTLISTDADANNGPVLDLFRDSGSPADDDLLGKIRFLGDNDAGGQLTYAAIETRIADASNGSEDGRIEFNTAVGGSGNVSRILIGGTETVVNDDSKDLDFRVESDGNANMLFVDGGNDVVGIGTNTMSDYHASFNDLVVDGGTNSGITIVSGATGDGTVAFADGTTSDEQYRGYIQYTHSSDVLKFGTAGTQRLNLNSTNLFPQYNDAMDLGGTSNKWDDIYATNGTIQTSDKNEKNTIVDSDLGLSFITELKPVSYKFNNKTRTHYGLIAQDVKETLDSISKSTENFAGYIEAEVEVGEKTYGLRYGEFIAPLIKAVQEQQTLIETLQTKVKALEEA